MGTKDNTSKVGDEVIMYNSSHIKRSWVEIDLDQIKYNYNVYKKCVNSNRIMAVIKADAYGHGAVKIALELQKNGLQLFAVSNIEEAIELRNAGIKGEILILGYTPVECADQLVQYDLTQTVLDSNYAESIVNRNIKAQIAIDTGMNRIGLDADNPDKCEEIIRKYNSKFKLTGLFTHLCVADSGDEDSKLFTESQIKKFEEIENRVADLDLPYLHFFNSAGGLYHRRNNQINEIARLGIVLYGLKPDYLNILPEGIKPALKWKSVVVMVKDVHSGESIGYGRTFVANREMKVATVPTGYADGYRRELSNLGRVKVNNNYVTVVGRVCMDQIMLDVSDISVNCGDEVILLDDEYTADDRIHCR